MFLSDKEKRLVLISPGASEVIRDSGFGDEPSLCNIPTEQGYMDGYYIPPGEYDDLCALCRKEGFDVEMAPQEGLSLRWNGRTISYNRTPHPLQEKVLGHVVRQFLESAATSTGRATFYTTREEQHRALEAIHRTLFYLDRGLYALMLTFGGITDHTRQMGVLRLLSFPRRGDETALLNEKQERELIRWIVRAMPPQRTFKLFEMIARARINNAQTRRLMLNFLLHAPRIELWSTRYRSRMRISLIHALGRRSASIIADILSKKDEARSDSERKILHGMLGAFPGREQKERIYECVAFILGVEKNLSLPLLLAYKGAKKELEAGAMLSFETLEGLRSTFHRDRSSAEVLALTKRQLTDGQRLNLQKKAAEDGVEISLDFSRYTPVRLYIYAFEMGMTEEIQMTLHDKARDGAARIPLSFRKIGVLVDCSLSMRGHHTQPFRPIAQALAIRDMLSYMADDTVIVHSGGEINDSLIKPSGHTSLAPALLDLVEQKVEMVFILSDGYENAPSGRLGEVMLALRRLGVTTPVYQLSPVHAAESGGVRPLTPELIPVMPVSEQESLALTFITAIMLENPVKALNAVISMLPLDEILKKLPLFEEGVREYAANPA
ncbi:MAG: VWA domain-containing protein [Candidatus Xenobiia bacterium LiM19]